MIIRWSAISFVGLALLWCFTWTKVGAWLPPGLEESRPELPYIHPYDLRKTPYRSPSPRPSSPQPSQQGPPASSDGVLPPYMAAEASSPFLNSEKPNVLPWLFFKPPESQNPPPPSEGQPDPPGSGSYVYFRPPNQPTPPISRHSSSVDSSLEKPPGLGYGPWLSPRYPVTYNPAVPGLSQLYPPGLQPPRNHRLPVIYYDSPSRFQGPSNPSTPKPVDQLPNYPSFSGPSVIQGSESPDSSLLPPKPDNPPSHGLPGRQLPQQSGNPPPDRSPKPSFSLPDYPPMFQMPRSLNDQTSEPQSVLPRGFYDPYFPQISQPQPPGKQIPVPLKPGVRDPNFQNCDVPTVQRIPCGGFGITATSCETMSCCFDGRNCYYPKYLITKPQPPENQTPFPVKPDPNAQTCDVPGVQRIPCGGFGITATSCETMSCCFDGRNCYYPKYLITKPQPPENQTPFPVKPDPNAQTCDVPGVQRIPCGGFVPYYKATASRKPDTIPCRT
ncbi:extensin-like [Syngnathus acus]|uniref:extensin-like n=1 Tax=Syngnathus acus TaxID=161584 RepID=UPI0018862218|nr:extensin-like [Syngnathus acus]